MLEKPNLSPMADWRRHGVSPNTWDGEILDIIYGHYKEALDLLPLEDKPELVPRLLDAGVCFGFADPVANIIANTLSFREPDTDGAKRRKRKRNTKNASEEARSRGEILSKIFAGEGPSPPEARTVAERSLEGLVSFLTSYFRYLPDWDAVRYLSLARADLLVAVSLVQKDHCYRSKDGFRVRSPAVKTALKYAAWSARQPNFDGFLAVCFALVSRINIITQTLSPDQGFRRFTVQDITLLSRLLANPIELKRSHKARDLVAKRFHDPGSEIAASIGENVPGELTKSLRGVLMPVLGGMVAAWNACSLLCSVLLAAAISQSQVFVVLSKRCPPGALDEQLHRLTTQDRSATPFDSSILISTELTS